MTRAEGPVTVAKWKGGSWHVVDGETERSLCGLDIPSMDEFYVTPFRMQLPRLYEWIRSCADCVEIHRGLGDPVL